MRALLQHGRLLRGRLESFEQLAVWQDDEEVQDRGDDEKRDHQIDEVAVEEFGMVDFEAQVREVRLPADRCYQRCDEILHQARNQPGESGTDDERNREVDEVASKEEFFESRHGQIQSLMVLRIIADHRKSDESVRYGQAFCLAALFACDDTRSFARLLSARAVPVRHHVVVTAADPTPATNPPFARTLTWSVVGAIHAARQIVNEQVSNHWGTVETQVAETPEGWRLNVTADVGGRVRFETFTVRRGSFEAANESGTFRTKGSFYAWRFLSHTLLWAACVFGAWFYLYQPAIVISLASIGVLLISPPFVSKALTQAMWWAGRGLVAEPRGRWIIAGVLWAVALAPIVELQIIVR